jgi:hypothetical protein
MLSLHVGRTRREHVDRNLESKNKKLHEPLDIILDNIHRKGVSSSSSSDDSMSVFFSLDRIETRSKQMLDEE